MSVPEELSSANAAPLLCAGLTTFSALRDSPAKAGDLVAVLGVGGLGHLGVQYARHMGFEVVAIGRGAGINVGPISKFTLDALRERGITPSGADVYPAACTMADLESADLVVALKEAEHRGLVSAQFPGWEHRVTFWHVHDIDVGSPVEAIEAIDRLIGHLILDIKSAGN